MKSDKTDKTDKTDQRLDLDKEVVADLEATDADTDAIKGGRSSGATSGTFRSGSGGGTT